MPLELSTKRKEELKKMKVGEFYIETLKEYQKKFDKDSLVLFVQVGEFYEMYGLEYENGKRVGNIWEICEHLGLKIADKKMLVYNDPKIQLKMAGVNERTVNKFIQMAVDKFQWTVVIFEQRRIGTSDKYERVETAIFSPGINIDSNDFSNISMNIYIEQITNYLNINRKKTTTVSGKIINIGMSYVDCLTGENGILNLDNNDAQDTAIPFDEIIKILTIKKPNEIIINVINCDITDDDLINSIHLFKYNHKIKRDPINEKFENLEYQRSLFNEVYKKDKGILDIIQQLDLDDIKYIYGRTSLCLLLEFIMKHDKTVINKLSKPEIINNSEKYLMLANNCLEQLDIIDNYKAAFRDKQALGLGRRVALCDLLDSTKTAMGTRALRKRISIPITDPDELNNRYNQIDSMIYVEKKFEKEERKKGKHDSKGKSLYSSPIYQIRGLLRDIGNIDRSLRKIIIMQMHPSELKSYYESINKCVDLIQLLKTIKTKYGIYIKTNNNISKKINKFKHIIYLIPDENILLDISKFLITVKDNIIFDNMPRLWSELENSFFRKGLYKDIDKVQSNVDVDRNLLERIAKELSNLLGDNEEVSIAANAKLGSYIYVNTAKKDKLFEITEKKKDKLLFKIGDYKFYGKSITYSKMRESKWQVCITQLKICGGSLKQNLEYLVRDCRKKFKLWLRMMGDTYGSSLEALSKFVADIDVMQSITYTSLKNGYVRPIIKLSDHSYINAKQIRHPIIEHVNRNTKYIPNDISLGSENQSGILLFGINAVGKSSCMKSIGINLIMAQAGMFVACDEMIYHPYQYLFTRIKNNDNLYAGLSSFEVEMKEFKVILKYANENSIILGDELCSGTETQDATALVASGVMQLSKRKSSFIFATHLHFLADMPYIKNLTNIKLYHMLVEKDPSNPSKLIYTRKLQPGNGPKSYGILVCESMALDDDFITLAKEIRHSMDKDKTFDQLDFKTSKYNTEKIVTYCETCANGTEAEDVHHINEQCTADSRGMIGNFHKNKKWNLVSLCKKCHNDVHAKPHPKLIIEGYVQTDSGIKLKYHTEEYKKELDNNAVKQILDEFGDNSPIYHDQPMSSHGLGACIKAPSYTKNDMIQSLLKYSLIDDESIVKIQRMLKDKYKGSSMKQIDIKLIIKKYKKILGSKIIY